MYKETRVRSVVKAITWRFLATMTTVLLVLFVADADPKLAFEVGGLELVIKLIIGYLHERGWNKLNIGKKEIKPFVVWITGLPGSGKSILATRLQEYLETHKYKTERISENHLQEIFKSAFSFDKISRLEQNKGMGYLAALLEKNGVMVIVPITAPYREDRDEARALCQRFIEVYVSTPQEICEQKDDRYELARQGKYEFFPGVGAPYEPPENPEVEVDLSQISEEEAFAKVKAYIAKYI